jgi:hypothetical protein
MSAEHITNIPATVNKKMVFITHWQYNTGCDVNPPIYKCTDTCDGCLYLDSLEKNKKKLRNDHQDHICFYDTNNP